MAVEVDLHLHTTYSDGRLTPAQLVDLCARRGLKVIAITDHDSTEGLEEALEEAQRWPGLTVVPGVELSTDVPQGEVHILGYFVDRDDRAFQEALASMRRRRVERARLMVEKLAELGVRVQWERVLELAAGGAVGRPHIAQAMVEAGYVRYPKEAFDRYLARHGPAYVERAKLSPCEAVAMLGRNGALAVMAHPTYSPAKSARDPVKALEATLTELKGAGLVGMEVYYGDYTPQQVAELRELADRLGLVPCGGSDYHASGNPGEPEPGQVGPPMESFQALKALKERRSGPSA